MSDDDDDDISLSPVVVAGSTAATAAPSVAAAARVRSRRKSRGEGTTADTDTDTDTDTAKRRGRIIAANVVLSAVLIFFAGLGLVALTRRKGNGGDNQSVFGSAGRISSMVPSIVPSTKPSVPPSDVPSSSSSPTMNPSDSPSLFPTTTPSSSPHGCSLVGPHRRRTRPTSFVPGDLGSREQRPGYSHEFRPVGKGDCADGTVRRLWRWEHVESTFPTV